MDLRPDKLDPRVLDDLTKRSTTGVFFYMLVPVVLVLTDHYLQRHMELSLAAFGTFCILCLLRLGHVLYWWRRVPKPLQWINPWLFFVSVLLTALAWGLGAAVVLSQEGEPHVQMLMIICTAGFCAGGVMSFMPLRRLAICYALLMLLPSTIAIFQQVDTPGLGVAMVLYGLYLSLITLRGSHEYWKALKNERLLEEKTRQLKKASRTDGLTGLFNRRHFDELFDLAWGLAGRQQTPLTLILCDIDHFKKVNDTYGHQAGDAYLRLLGGHLKAVFQRETDVVARYGGEEFAMLLTGRDAIESRPLAERLRQQVAKSGLPYEGENIRTTLSIGMASCIPGPDLNRDRLITRADNALYDAKAAGRNTVMTDVI